MVKANRAKQSGSTYNGGISFRYDWRALLSVMRMRLPPRETLVGPSVQTFTDYWGGKANPSLSSITSPASFKTGYCSLAGGDEELCSSSLESSSSNNPPLTSSSSESTSSFQSSSSSSESIPLFQSSSSSSSSQQTTDDDDDGCISAIKECKRKYYVCRKKGAQNPENCLYQWEVCVEGNKLEETKCFPNAFDNSLTECMGV